MILRIVLLGLALFGAAPAAACTVVATRCEPDGCGGPLYRLALREREQRAAIEHGRALARAVEARRDATGLDRDYDLARIVFPLIIAPVDLAEGGGCGPNVPDAHGFERNGRFAVDAFEAELRRSAGMDSTQPLGPDALRRLAALRMRCQDEVVRGFTAYLGTALSPDKRDDLWNFLVPRAGLIPPVTPAEPLPGYRFTARTGSPDGLMFNEVPAASYIARSRERAWQYLENHRNGRALMSAVRQYLLLLDGREASTLCPAASGSG